MLLATLSGDELATLESALALLADMRRGDEGEQAQAEADEYDRLREKIGTRPRLREVRFTAEDFDPILEAEGVDPGSVTEYEWGKFTDRFLDGTHWTEIAGYAVDAIRAARASAP